MLDSINHSPLRQIREHVSYNAPKVRVVLEPYNGAVTTQSLEPVPIAVIIRVSFCPSEPAAKVIAVEEVPDTAILITSTEVGSAVAAAETVAMLPTIDTPLFTMPSWNTCCSVLITGAVDAMLLFVF
jgi:hypothetical protein